MSQGSCLFDFDLGWEVLCSTFDQSTEEIKPIFPDDDDSTWERSGSKSLFRLLLLCLVPCHICELRALAETKSRSRLFRLRISVQNLKKPSFLEGKEVPIRAIFDIFIFSVKFLVEAKARKLLMRSHLHISQYGGLDRDLSVMPASPS
ncbi:hypothetical protein Patl1_22286 [Pistacia atlantica]|uniref:Uncharacterized protein n=1 Tax=Pistacia atlantica TaxID=434234 RepID=A0ACC0ZY96_9ROSI|nr:hypothetical protein Patl1_22286 [Pistacia atlantica]